MKITDKQISGAVIITLILAMLALAIYWVNNRDSRVGPEYEVGGSGAAGCIDASFVTTETETSCASERVLTGTANQVAITDNGANSTVVLSLPQSIATTSDVTFDDVIVNGVLGLDSVSEFLALAAPATIRLGGRDNVIIELDTNANSTSDFCIRANNVASDIFCIDESGNVTLATLDGDLNVFVDIKPDSFDSVDSGADEECLTYEGTNQVEWQPCGAGGGHAFNTGLPIPAGSTPTDTAYIGVPGVGFNGTGGGAFVTANDIYYEPYNVDEEITVDRLSILVTSAGNPDDECRMAAYTADSEWQPIDLVVDGGVVVVDSLGWKHASITPTVFAVGSYVNALICESSPALGDHSSDGSYFTSLVNTGLTTSTRFARTIRDSAPSGTPLTGFADPAVDFWDTVDMSTGTFGRFILMRWSVN